MDLNELSLLPRVGHIQAQDPLLHNNKKENKQNPTISSCQTSYSKQHTWRP